MERITSKVVDVNGRKFTIEKFDPCFATYIAFQTFGDVIGSKNKLDAMVKSITNRSQEEFIKLQLSILKYCYEKLPVGKVCIVDENNHFAVPDITGPVALNLMIQTLFFSLSDFFNQGAMEGLAEAVESIVPSPKKN